MVILMNGAPGTGKTTVSALLHEAWKCPWFEFGWIPEFRHLNPHTQITYEEEEQLSFENLMLVTRNYLRHGYARVLISDLRPEKVLEAADALCDCDVRVITLYADEQTIRHRVRTRNNGNTYRDEDAAVKINAQILSASPRACEMRMDTGCISPEEVARRICESL